MTLVTQYKETTKTILTAVYEAKQPYDQKQEICTPNHKDCDPFYSIDSWHH